ncbi:hypothetical protein HNR23_002653 [Nocardiopsis mwathae]|uniref:DUF11 domain-containing protein n=1 Tax=Nocardiopsis mwathae TaxID=1472723 RepID=A0A7X0D5T2_9ACTN|nr:hypothetical protein [Nocardiopsis mwathae]MBB6172593.1 hypothetical protein [Nocardiopsis mwathae]
MVMDEGRDCRRRGRTAAWSSAGAVGLVGAAALAGAFVLPAEARGDRVDEVDQPDQQDQADREGAGAEGESGRFSSLSVSVSDGRHWMKAQDESQYVVNVRNDGEERVERILLSQSVPPGMEIVEVGQNGVAYEGAVAWEADLGAGEELVRTVTMRLGEVSGDEDAPYVATTACVQLEEGGEAVACATDANLLRAEKDGEESKGSEEQAEAAAGEGGMPRSTLLGAGLGAAFGLGAVLLLWWRRARRAAM